jgi:hypothetical protein
MKYTVIWKPAAERQLTQLWLASGDRAAVTLAARQLDQTLQIDPEDVGESRDSGRRITFESPLGCTFSVHPVDMLVRVLRVWSTERR